MTIVDLAKTSPNLNEMSIVQLAKDYAHCRSGRILAYLEMKDKQLNELLAIHRQDVEPSNVDNYQLYFNFGGSHATS